MDEKQLADLEARKKLAHYIASNAASLMTDLFHHKIRKELRKSLLNAINPVSL